MAAKSVDAMRWDTIRADEVKSVGRNRGGGIPGAETLWHPEASKKLLVLYGILSNADPCKVWKIQVGREMLFH